MNTFLWLFLIIELILSPKREIYNTNIHTAPAKARHHRGKQCPNLPPIPQLFVNNNTNANNNITNSNTNNNQ